MIVETNSITESLPNILYIKNTKPNLPPPVVMEFMIVDTDFIILTQSPMYHKFPS